MAKTDNIPTLTGKLKLEATLQLLTGMHIGASKDFAPIGAVDSVCVRDPLTMRPLIPGSSLKGKLRTLLARSTTDGLYLKNPNEDPDLIKRLFGSSDPVKFSRLQFYDVFITDNSVKRIEKMNTDLYLSEIKFENSINRMTAIANPRQIERIPAGAEFDFKLVYNIEDLAEVTADLTALANAMKLLELDYLGGHGSRGYGRIEWKKLTASLHTCAKPMPLETQEILKLFTAAGLHAV